MSRTKVTEGQTLTHDKINILSQFLCRIKYFIYYKTIRYYTPYNNKHTHKGQERSDTLLDQTDINNCLSQFLGRIKYSIY